MHPAPSIILFTVLSGFGFGMLAWLGLGVHDVTGWMAFWFFFIAFALAIIGLLAASFHLGNPKNALKSFTQWQTSWLSREACCSVAALLAMGVFAIGRIFFGIDLVLIGLLGAMLSMITVFTTSMMYAQLKTVPRWRHPLTVILFLGYASVGGAFLTGQISVTLWGLLALGIVQIIAWVHGDGAFQAAGSTMETATGLGRIGGVRQFEAPHTGGNYLLHEMVYVIGRKHAFKLRAIGLILMAVLPALLLWFAPNHFVGAIALLCHFSGLLVIRWLFFAQAEHVVGLYYGQRG